MAQVQVQRATSIQSFAEVNVGTNDRLTYWYKLKVTAAKSAQLQDEKAKVNRRVHLKLIMAEVIGASCKGAAFKVSLTPKISNQGFA